MSDVTIRTPKRVFGLLGAMMAFLVAASPAAAQISGASVTTTGSTGNSGNGDGSTRSSVHTITNNGSTLATRFAWNVTADTGSFSTRDQSGSARHNVDFDVEAPGSYTLSISTTRVGVLNRDNESIPTCDGAADTSSISGSHTGPGSLSGALGLGDPGGIGNGGSTTSIAFNQGPTSATITDISDDAVRSHDLDFTWSGSVRSNACEAGVRQGEGSSVSGCDSCIYPGSPSRTQGTDGHFVTVTFESHCGNSTIDGTGEECDLGGANGSTTSCCDSHCQFRNAGQTCRVSGGVCDPLEACTGSSANCPGDLKSSAQCRGSAGVCDLIENCDGVNNACPLDFKSTAQCRGSAGICDVAEFCDGAGNLCPSNGFVPSTTTCRPAAGVCDQPENCTGGTAACPGNTFLPGSTICRGSAGVCDLQENCTGTANCPADAKSSASCRNSAGVCDVTEFCNGVGNDCPVDGFVSGATPCRGSGGVCDLTENCTGSGPACPGDGKSTAECRASAGECDVAEICDGANNACPNDDFLPATSVCRGSAGDCDIAENCTGSGASCPADAFEPTTTECRGSAGDCDIAENCDGGSANCPADAFQPTTLECRGAAGDCDIAENCDGASANCPADAFEPSTTECRGVAGVCDLAENCPGSGPACPNDDKSTAECRPTAGVCDVAESCDGVGDDCPTDEFEPGTTSCRASAGVCDLAENCSGSTADCPADAFQASTVVCRADAGQCDVGESCTGSTAACPGDTLEPDGTSCNDANTCTIDDECTGGVCGGNSATCGDDIIQGTCGEDCDDGNLDPNDGCSPTCEIEPGLACPDTPLTGCRRPFIAQKASIVIADKSPNDAKNIFKWKWIRGERTTVGEYGTPLTSTNYQLCVYDQTGRLSQATIPAGGQCGASNPKPCWKTSGVSGFKYKDKDMTPNGVQKLVLKEGADGKAKIQLIAKGTLLQMPDLAAISQPLTIQIQNSSGLCFEAIYSVPPTKQTPAQFKDKAD